MRYVLCSNQIHNNIQHQGWKRIKLPETISALEKFMGPPYQSHDTITLPSLKLTAKAPENGWLEYYFPFRTAYFQVRLLLVSGSANKLILILIDYDKLYLGCILLSPTVERLIGSSFNWLPRPRPGFIQTPQVAHPKDDGSSWP